MSHPTRDRQKLLHRVRRIRGQVEGIEKALVDENDPFLILQTVAACRGALNGLTAEIIEGHIRLHVLDQDVSRGREQSEATEQLIDIVRAFMK